MSTPVIDAVLFDLFETLITESGTVTQRASALAARLRVDHEAYRHLWRFRRSDIVLGRSSFSDVLSWIATRLGTSPDEKLVEQLRSERLAEKAAVLHTVEPDVLATLATLRTKRLGLAVVTNCFAEDVASWEGSPLRPYFDVTVFSCTAGLAKPDPEIYLRACRELDVAPDRALYVGDGGDDELAGARRAGLSTCRALWFLSRWPHVVLRPEDPGLWHVADVVNAAA